MKIEVHSESWKAVSSHVEGRIAKLIRDIQRSGMDLTITEYTRGQLKAFQEVLSLADEKRPDARPQ